MIIRILMSCLTLHMCMQPLFAQLPERWTDCEEIWLPEKAIEDIVKNNTVSNYSKFSTPIQSLVVCNEELYVQTLFGKVVKPKFEQIGNKKELIQPLVLNLKYFNKGDFKDTRFFLSDKGQDGILLEIVNEEKIDKWVINF